MPSLKGLGRYIIFCIKSLSHSVFLLVMVVAVFAGYRIVTYEQKDDANRLVSKQQYLERISLAAQKTIDRPNIIFVLYDDLGYGDIGAGVPSQRLIKTPNIDRLAQQGVSMNNFYAPAPVCTPSRAGYLTGRLPLRAGLPHVVFPTNSPTELLAGRVLNPEVNGRLPSDEITIANVLEAAGYRTGMVGKWHLGDRSPSLPNDMGFDYFFGSHYSNDMEPFALYRNRDIEISAPADQRFLSERYSKEVVSFIEKESNQPFFLYLAHNFPHDPLYVREERLGHSEAGLFGDVLEELDQGIGEMVAALEASGQLENTLIIISSDNGPWYLGNAGNQRGRKGNTFEGGMRVPFIAYWQAKIKPAQTSAGRIEQAMAMGTDLLPTVLDILQLPSPQDRMIDGRSILKVLTEGAATPHEVLYYFDGLKLFAVRDKRFKYRGPAGVFYSTDESPVAMSIPQKEWLFDLRDDPRESYDTSDRYPQVLEDMQHIFADKVEEMQENPRGWL